jgi:putative ABC transport system substrate-binding protein
MHRRRLLLGAGALLIVSPLGAQTRTKLARVGYLSLATPEADRRWLAALVQGLRELRYVEGHNLLLEVRHASNDTNKVKPLLADLLARELSVLVVYGSPAIAIAKDQAGDLPVVMTVHADPVGAGIVPNLGRPGGHVTGFTDGHAELAPKRLELIKEAVAEAKRIGVMLNPLQRHVVRQLDELRRVSSRLDVTIVPMELTSAAEIERTFAAVVKHRLDAVLLLPEPSWSVGQERRIADLALKQRVAVMGTVREFAEHGMLLSYGTNFAELWRRSALYVDKILKGEKAGDLPIEQPTKFDLVINQRTARAIGLEVPRTLLLRADHVIT